MAENNMTPEASAALPGTPQDADNDETPLLLSNFTGAGGSFADEESGLSTTLSNSRSASGSGDSVDTPGLERCFAPNSLIAILLTILLVLLVFVLYLLLRWISYRSVGAWC
ncbi:hypothetical protein I7I48_07253 [Histoplasma ohiense]|nr:hypothetical protein I7I48_07253 [Histoplasma ohiense (nom. inval.)]